MRAKFKTYRFFVLIVGPKINMDLLWDLTALFAALCALYFGVIFFFRSKFSRSSKKVRKRKKELAPMVSEFLFFDENAPKEEQANYVNLKIEIRELLTDKFSRRVLIDILMDLRKDLSGETLKKLFELYQSLGLHQDSYTKLKSWWWQTISKGILELTQMHVAESYGFVTKFINTRRATVRKQAEIAIVTLKSEGISYFLDTTKYRISEWQQLKILEVLKSKKDFLPPSFQHWLISKNKDVVLFALRLMKHYNQTDGNQALIELLKHRNSEIKHAAVECIKDFHVVEALETLKLVFWNSKVDIKIHILDAIGALGDGNDLVFLNSIGVKESNFNVKSKALAAINAIMPMSIMPTRGIQDVGKFKVPEDIPADRLKKEASEALDYDEDMAIEKEHVPAQDKKPLIELEIEDTTEESNQMEEVGRLEDMEQSMEPEIELEDHLKDTGEQIAFQGNIEPEAHDPKFEVYDMDVEAEIENPFETDFLPMVTEPQKIDKSERDSTEANSINGQVNLNDYEVEYFEVDYRATVDNDYGEIEESADSIDEIDFSIQSELLDFLPIVVASEAESNADDREIGNPPFEIKEIDVIYSKVAIETSEFLPNKILSELNELVPLPKVPRKKIEIEKTTDVKKDSIVPQSITQIDMNKINKIECKGVEIKIDKQSKAEENEPTEMPSDQEKVVEPIESESLSTLDWIMAENEAETELKGKIKAIVSEQQATNFKLPKPIIYTKEQAETAALLDDIEALGDQREVPLLQSMLLDEQELVLRQRISSLIEKISDTSVLKREPVKSSANVELISVFDEYFKRIDVESKIILLDEIVAVGDEKELAFLKRLTEDSSPEVRKKAKYCLERLAYKLGAITAKEQNETLTSEKETTQDETTMDEIESKPEGKMNAGAKDEVRDIFNIEFGLEVDNNERFEKQAK